MSGDDTGGPRPLGPADMGPARTLIRSALADTPYADRILELLDEAARPNAESRTRIIEREGTVTALALYAPVAGAVNVWRLDTVLVLPHPDFRDVGRAIIGGVVEDVRLAAGRVLLAELPADAVIGRSLSLLRANGFRQEARIPDFFRDGVALLFLRREL